MKRIIKCALCGKEVMATGRAQKYCPECSKELKLIRERKRRHKKHTRQTRENASIAEVARRAKAAGLTYGQYVMMGGRLIE